VWGLVANLLKIPNLLRAGLERLVEEERRAARGDPNREAEVWAKKLAEVDRKRSAYQDQQAEGLITLDELRSKLAALRKLAIRPVGDWLLSRSIKSGSSTWSRTRMPSLSTMPAWFPKLSMA
jgi:hypothetical protein